MPNVDEYVKELKSSTETLKSLLKLIQDVKDATPEELEAMVPKIKIMTKEQLKSMAPPYPPEEGYADESDDQVEERGEREDASPDAITAEPISN